MRNVALVRTLVALLVLALVGWFIHKTRWEEVEVDDPAHGAAEKDAYYSLRHVLEGAGATLEVRTTLDPMPPAGATLLLESSVWDIFPDRDARLKAWVENGGRLVVLRWSPDGDVLRWVPLSFVQSHRAASEAEDGNGNTGDGAPATRPKPRTITERQQLQRVFIPQHPWDRCENLSELDSPEPAFEPGRVYRGCAYLHRLQTLNHVVPTWQLTSDKGTLAMRVPIGHGNVTGLTSGLVTDNQGLLHGDNGLIATAVLQAAPGRVVWIVRDEAREPLLAWLWHEGRTPLLLALAAIALALWRLMVRFGPREAVPPQARRSMGEQIRGTGHFIAGSDARALHAATRQAFDAVARGRVEGWAELDDDARVEALAAALAPSHAIDRAALRASLSIGGGATPAQILAATSVLEHARRALLRVPAPN